MYIIFFLMILYFVCEKWMEITIQKNLMKLLEIFLLLIPFLIYTQYIYVLYMMKVY